MSVKVVVGCGLRVLFLRFILFSSFIRLYATARMRQTELVSAGAFGA